MINLPPSAPDNLACVLDGYEKWLIATTFRDTWNACLAEVQRLNATAHPAKILRPVELPAKVSCEGFNTQEANEARGMGQCEGYNSALDACAEALRQQGYEVKS